MADGLRGRYRPRPRWRPAPLSATMGKAINPRTAVIPPVRVTPEELAELRRRAEKARMTVAEYVRHCTIRS